MNDLKFIYSEKKLPTPTNRWKNLRYEEKKILVEIELKKENNEYLFEVFNIENNGQVILKTTKSILANKRGVLLLDLEERLKKNIDNALTVWLEPVGDKSKLRNLRGIKIKSI